MIVGVPYDAEVEYIESTGLEWIDIGMPLSSADTIYADFRRLPTSGTSAVIFGVRTNALSRNISCGIYPFSSTTSDVFCDFADGDYSTYRCRAINTTAPGDYHVEISAALRWIETPTGYVATNTIFNPAEFITARNCRIFGGSGSFWSGATNFTGRFYGFKIERNGNLVRNLIPVRYTNANGVSEGAMYDRVSRKLFVNGSGSGAFLFGSDVSMPVMSLHAFYLPYWGLAFTAEQAGSTVSMAKVGAAPAVSLETSVDGGKTWTPFVVGETTITLANVGDSVCFRAGDGGTGGDGVNLAMAISASENNLFDMSGRIAASGDISSILDRRGTVDRLNDSYCFCRLFYQCTSLTVAPELPATTLAEQCYANMFYGCTSLTTAPELPAMTLARNCYYQMFCRCTAMTAAPELPATTLATGCYRTMFYGCTSLTAASELPATTLAGSCYRSMFYGCTSLTAAPELPATTLADSCYYQMFYRCTALTTAPELPATTSERYCYSYMFNGCTSLTAAPELPATTLAVSCYANMFQNCTALTAAPELPATTLADSCYGNMFYGCTSLTTAPELPATTLADSCYANMFQSCTALAEAPELPAIISASKCYSYMFRYCTSLTNAPEVHATTLANDCCEYMFSMCRQIARIKVHFTNWATSRYATNYWVIGIVNQSGTFICPESLPHGEDNFSDSGIPPGWTVQTFDPAQEGGVS